MKGWQVERRYPMRSKQLGGVVRRGLTEEAARRYAEFYTRTHGGPATYTAVKTPPRKP